MEYVVYTDGSCENNSKYKEGGAAYVVLLNGTLIHEASRGCVRTTNNRQEMMAIISAINYLPQGSSVTIYSDSEYAIGVFSGKYKKAKKNPDLKLKYFSICGKLKEIKFIWVKGHVGNEWNEYVDTLAGMATKSMQDKYNLPKVNRYKKRNKR